MDPASLDPPFTIQPNRSTASDDAVNVKRTAHEYARIRRRGSLDERPTSYSPAFLIHVEQTRDLILAQEDTDRNAQVTIEDSGPKFLTLSSAHSQGLSYRSIKGHYMISNLLQELALAGNQDDAEDGSRLTSERLRMSPRPRASHMVIEERTLNENPIYRLCKMITGIFWPNLRRSISLSGLRHICRDEKNRGRDQQPRIYIPPRDKFAREYYRRVAELLKPEFDLDVQVLPEELDEQFVRDINEHPGILSLQLRIKTPLGLWQDAPEDDPMAVPANLDAVHGVPFIVPGGRFNEMYGWDSYFSALGLLKSIQDSNKRRLDDLYLAKSMADNCCYEIRHYGKVLNANRSYYLLRTQPPFLTDMAWQIYQELCRFVDEPQSISGAEVEALLLSETPRDWLRKMTRAAMEEYYRVWMQEPRLVPHIGLSRYYGAGRGLPPETEQSHFNAILLRFARQSAYHSTDPREIAADYNAGRFKCPDLDEYLLHDRAVRESGHDTTYRLDGRCANLVTVDLNSLLYKYEVDIARLLDAFFAADFPEECAAEWRRRAQHRQQLMDQYLWSEEAGQYYDYDVVKGESVIYDSATAFWPLWAGATSETQAERLVATLLPKLEMAGGMVSGTEASRGSISLDRPSRQWDYPYGWAPHQIMIWQGLLQSPLPETHGPIARRLAYRWLYTILRAYVNYHGVVPEKFNVVTGSHRISAEYGNVGTEFRMVAREGFGWMNASFMLGIRLLGRRELRALGALIEPAQLYAPLQ